MVEEGLVARMRRSLISGQNASEVEEIAMRLERRLERLHFRRPECATIQLSEHVRRRLLEAVPA